MRRGIQNERKKEEKHSARTAVRLQRIALRAEIGKTAHEACEA